MPDGVPTHFPVRGLETGRVTEPVQQPPEALRTGWITATGQSNGILPFVAVVHLSLL